MTQSIRERFDAKWIPEPNTGCWLWTASLNKAGYGHFWIDDEQTKRAHRHAWMLYRGPIPEGMFIDHICRVRSCVNPDHLRVVTPRVNALENSESLPAKALGRDTCKRGHPLVGDNLIEYLLPARICRKCRIGYSRAGRKRRRADLGASIPLTENGVPEVRDGDVSWLVSRLAQKPDRDTARRILAAVSYCATRQGGK